jgi:hypothetical protein
MEAFRKLMSANPNPLSSQQFERLEELKARMLSILYSITKQGQNNIFPSHMRLVIFFFEKEWKGSFPMAATCVSKIKNSNPLL